MNIFTNLKRLFGRPDISLDRNPLQQSQLNAGRLQQAIFQCDSAEVQRLLDNGVDPNQADFRGRLALYEAAEQGELSTVRSLLKTADVNLKQFGKTPLYGASATGRPEIVKLLLEHGAEVNAANEPLSATACELADGGQSPLLAAIKRFNELYSANENNELLGNWLESQGARDALSYRGCIEALLQAGANALFPNVEGYCPLDVANGEILNLIEAHSTGAKADVLVVGEASARREFFVGRLKATGNIVLTSCISSLKDNRKREFLLQNTQSCVVIGRNEGSALTVDDLREAFGNESLLVLEDHENDFMSYGQLEAIWQEIHSTCDLDASYSDLLFSLRQSDTDWDLFISYKSHDAALARALAEHLMGCGLRVWMAEYQILISARPEFQERINRGIAGSKKILFLTRDAHANSAYCWLEVVLGLELCKSDQMLEVALDDAEHRAAAQLRQRSVRRVCWNSESTEGPSRELSNWLGLRGDSIFHYLKTSDDEDGTARDRTSLRFRNAAVSMHPGSWQVSSPKPSLRQNELATVANLSLQLNSGNEIKGKVLALNPHFSFGLSIDSLLASETDDRDRFLANLEAFRKHYGYRLSQLECRGVHLIHIGEEGYPGYTYIDDHATLHPTEVEPTALSNDSTLIREYAITQVHPRSMKPVELRFLFWVPAVKHGMDQAFRVLLGAGQHMESLVVSTHLEALENKCDVPSIRSIIRSNPERVIMRALAMMTLVQRAYTEEEIFKNTPTKQLATKSSRSAREWAKREGITREMSSREIQLLLAPMGTWSAYDRHTLVNQQGAIPVFLWSLGLAPLPILTRHPENDIYKYTRFQCHRAVGDLVSQQRETTVPSQEELVEFATSCFIYASRLRAARVGDRRGGDSAKDAIAGAGREGFLAPVRPYLLEFSSDGDLRVPLFGLSASKLNLRQIFDAGLRCECQLRACDVLGIPSPGAELRAQFAMEHNLNRIAPTDVAVAEDPWGTCCNQDESDQ